MLDSPFLPRHTTLGARIRACRQARRWSQQDLASKISTTAKHVSDLERDQFVKDGPYYRTVENVARALGFRLCAFENEGPCPCHAVS